MLCFGLLIMFCNEPKGLADQATFCQNANPIYLSHKDTRKTKEQVDRFNRTGKRLCDWGREQAVMEDIKKELSLVHLTLAEVEVTQRFFKDAVTEMKTELSNVVEELHETNQHLGKVVVNLTSIEKNIEDHEKRIRELKSYDDKQLGYIGIAAMFGAAITWAIDHISKFFK